MSCSFNVSAYCKTNKQWIHLLLWIVVSFDNASFIKFIHKHYKPIWLLSTNFSIEKREKIKITFGQIMTVEHLKCEFCAQLNYLSNHYIFSYVPIRFWGCAHHHSMGSYLLFCMWSLNETFYFLFFYYYLEQFNAVNEHIQKA